MGINYSVEADPETTAKGMLRDRPISVKDSKEISRYQTRRPPQGR